MFLIFPINFNKKILKIWLEIWQPQDQLTFYPQDKIWITETKSVFDDYWKKNKLVLTENSVITRGGPLENIIVMKQKSKIDGVII